MSDGERDVCRAVMDDAGDCRFRNEERNRRRNRWGMKRGIAGHGKARRVLIKDAVAWPAWAEK